MPFVFSAPLLGEKHGPSKLILQKWYYETPQCPLPVREETICDQDGVSCRRYIVSSSTRLALAQLGLAQKAFSSDPDSALASLEQAIAFDSTLHATASLRAELLFKSFHKRGFPWEEIISVQSALIAAVDLCPADMENRLRLVGDV
jgi:hypothetical protein